MRGPDKASVAVETEDQRWADLLSPDRRRLLVGSGIAAAGAIAGGTASAAPAAAADLETELARGPLPARNAGESPWGAETFREPAAQPVSIRPGEAALPSRPRAYTDIKSYHAHIYFDEDTYEKAALLRKWAVERFPVELGNWNLEPRGPHVTPSFYFGFTNDLLPVLVPWLQLNSLGLTILLHPNTNDPRADHLHYALWVNRAQPVNGYRLSSNVSDDEIEVIRPNITPTVAIETS